MQKAHFDYQLLLLWLARFQIQIVMMILNMDSQLEIKGEDGTMASSYLYADSKSMRHIQTKYYGRKIASWNANKS